MTVVVQSSSATIAVLQNLASTAGPDGVTSIIGLQGALPILFGDNIGTTITAVLASIGASVTAKRTAAAHVIFNLTGTLLFIWFIPYYAKFIQFISPSGAEVDVISRPVSYTHLREYMRPGSLKLTAKDEQYLYNTVDRIERIEKETSSSSGGSSGGSTTHVSSSGTTHGGSSGKF